MGEDECPDLLWFDSQWRPDEDGEIGIGGDAEGPPAGAAVTVRDIRHMPGHEVG